LQLYGQVVSDPPGPVQADHWASVVVHAKHVLSAEALHAAVRPWPSGHAPLQVSHAVLPCADWYVLPVQPAHVAWPAALVYVPAAQSPQEPAVDAPVAALALPAAQRVHALCAALAE
jgi:hypothetical protein